MLFNNRLRIFQIDGLCLSFWLLLYLQLFEWHLPRFFNGFIQIATNSGSAYDHLTYQWVVLPVYLLAISQLSSQYSQMIVRQFSKQRVVLQAYLNLTFQSILLFLTIAVVVVGIPNLIYAPDHQLGVFNELLGLNLILWFLWFLLLGLVYSWLAAILRQSWLAIFIVSLFSYLFGMLEGHARLIYFLGQFDFVSRYYSNHQTIQWVPYFVLLLGLLCLVGGSRLLLCAREEYR